LIVAFTLSACRPGAEDVPAAVESVVADAAGVRVAMLPEGFEVVSNGEAGLTLSASPSGGVEITLGDVVEGGLNIVETLNAELAAFEALPDGESFGHTQIVAPIGLTYLVRGRYAADGGTTEELRALVAHPWGNRLLTVAYRYPLGEDTVDRGNRLMELLGEIEPLDEPQPEEASEDS
jgi:hypothetical protein